MNISKHIKKLSSALIVALITGFAFTSCSTIFDYEGDCSYTYHVKFEYTKNILNAEAFAGNVMYISLYVFDAETGLLVYTGEDSGDALNSKDYMMQLDLNPGTYDLLAWCGTAVADNKVIVPEVEVGKTTMEEVDCIFDRFSNAEHSSCILENIGNLFHGKERVTFTDDEGKHVHVLSLTKNTNSVRIVLQSLQKGQYLSKDDFDFRIQDCNGNMNYDNSLAACELMTYHAWGISEISAGVDADVNDDVHKKLPTRADNTSTAVMAELTIGRLMTENEPKLVVYNKTSEALVLSIPLKDYALMVKGYGYSHWSDQEYLDRQDNYTMTFFLDELGTWVASHVIINDWKIVLQSSEL